MKKLFAIAAITVISTATMAFFGLKPSEQKERNLYPILENNLYGYIDKTGKVIIKPQFLSAGQFSEGLAPVRLNGTYGYIDTTGTFVIPPQFGWALSFNSGLARVFMDNEYYFIDKKGNALFKHNYQCIEEFGKNSFATVTTHTGKYGVINKSGNLIIDTIFSRISRFEDGVAVVAGLNHRYDPYIIACGPGIEKKVYEKGVIDTLGNWIVKYGEYKFIEEFVNGYAFVELMKYEPITRAPDGSIWKFKGVIDKTGKYIPSIPNIKQNLSNVDGYYKRDVLQDNIKKNMFEGYLFSSDFYPWIYYGDVNGVDDDLIYVIKDKKSSYVNRAGKQIWEEQIQAEKKQLNIDYMNRGYLEIWSKYKKELVGDNSWINLDDSLEHIHPNITFSSNALQVVIDSTHKTEWNEKYSGIKLFVVNTTNDTVYSPNYMPDFKIQAQDRNGKWRDIEYMPRTYHEVYFPFLATDELWDFTMPVYQGEFKTKIRAQFSYIKNTYSYKYSVIYSNEIDASINLSQFWNRKTYYMGVVVDLSYD